jgi:hypothetical protein
LKGHIEGLLRELDASNVVTGSYGSVGAATPSGFQGFGAN